MDFPRMCPARWLTDQNFGMGIPPHDFMYPFYDMHSNYYRPWKWHNQSISKEFASTVENEKGNYKITLDVQHFHAEEINVKVTNDEIIVEGKHEERPDTHGFITRQFRRRYPLPNHCPSENVTSTLSSDGILTIIAEKRSSKDIEKIVPIRMCGTCPRRTQIETNISSEMSQKIQKENIKESEDFMSRNKTQIMQKEDHSRLLKPEFLKETISETNGTCIPKAATKDTINIMRTPEKSDPLNIGGTSSKIEESIGKSILGLTALTEQLSQSSLASTSEMRGMKSASEVCGNKNASEMCAPKNAPDTYGMKNASEQCGMKSPSEQCGMKSPSAQCGMKSTLEMCGMKSASETCGMKIASDMFSTKDASEMKTPTETCSMKSKLEKCEVKAASDGGMKTMSKMLLEESSSSYKASSTMSSSTRISGKTGECVSDIISAELREAAENV